MLRLGVGLLLAAASFLQPAFGQEEPRSDFIILSPHLSGEDELSKGITNLLRLQISGTFREGGTNTRGRMVWGEHQLKSGTNIEAVLSAMSPTTAAHLVLWGDTYGLSDGVVAQTFLSVTPRLLVRESRPEVWSIDVGDPDGLLALGLPRYVYQFPPILVSNEAASEYETLRLPIFDTPAFENKIGEIGTIFRAFEYTGTGVRLTSEGTTGWVRLDFVSQEQSIIIEFVGAVIRLCRGDLDGARELLLSAEARADLPVMLRTDIAVLQGLIKELKNSSGLADFRHAAELSPLNRNTVAYLLMGEVAETKRASNSEARAQAVKMLADDIDKYGSLFAENNPWLGLVRDFVSGEKQ